MTSLQKTAIWGIFCATLYWALVLGPLIVLNGGSRSCAQQAAIVEETQ